jgi:hypothetical protein
MKTLKHQVNGCCVRITCYVWLDSPILLMQADLQKKGSEQAVNSRTIVCQQDGIAAACKRNRALHSTADGRRREGALSVIISKIVIAATTHQH